MRDEKAPEATGRAQLQTELPTHKSTVAGSQGELRAAASDSPGVAFPPWWSSAV